MIRPTCFNTEWIDEVAARLKLSDKILVEKVIRALSLLEMLVTSKCPMVFKGGTALMLLLGKSHHRLSIDIDIICPPGTSITDYLTSFHDYGFSGIEMVERAPHHNIRISKSHTKMYYQMAYKTGLNESSYILLDVLYENTPYIKTKSIDIDSPLVQLDGEPLKVVVPSEEDLLGDKLTAFAPYTTGIPYQKNGKSCSMEIVKQLYDVGRLFDKMTHLRSTSETFGKIAMNELSYRAFPTALPLVFDDIRQTALCLSTRGKAGVGDFEALQDGILRIRSFLYQPSYHIEHAIVDAAKAAYAATLIEKNIDQIEKYTPDTDVGALEMPPTLTNKLNKLKKNLPEAYFYWTLTGRLMMG